MELFNLYPHRDAILIFSYHKHLPLKETELAKKAWGASSPNFSQITLERVRGNFPPEKLSAQDMHSHMQYQLKLLTANFVARLQVCTHVKSNRSRFLMEHVSRSARQSGSAICPNCVLIHVTLSFRVAQAETLNNAFTQDPQLTRMYINVREAMHSSSMCHLTVKSARQCHECLTATESARPAVDNSEVTNW